VGNVGEQLEAAAEEAELGSRPVTKMKDPKLPGEAEIREHQLTHLPFRSWCRHCVRGRGIEEAHHKSKGEGGDLPEFSMDFAFPNEETREKGAEREKEGLVVLVVRMRETKMVMASVVPGKSTGQFMAKRVMAFFRECGHEFSEIIVKSDQEPAMMAIVTEIAKERAKKGAKGTIPENSPRYSSGSNGVVERAIGSAVAQMRVMRSALEDRLEILLGSKHAAWAWMAEYGGYLLNRQEVGHDGKTSYERNKGKKGKVSGIEFFEGVLWKRKPSGGGLGKLAIMWNDGVFLGVKGTTGEFIVGDANGIHRTRTLTRKPEQERWKKGADGNLSMVIGVPWRQSEDDPNKDGEGMDCTAYSEETRAELEKKLEFQNTLPRRFAIRLADVEKHGPTEKCPGCRALVGGKSHQGHSEVCRKRFEEKMAGDARVEESSRKTGEFLARAIERDVRQRTEGELGGMANGGNEASSSSTGLPFGTPISANMDVDVVTIGLLMTNDEPDEATEVEELPELGEDGLNLKLVEAARQEEMDFVKSIPVYEEVDTDECWRRTGRPPVSTKWVDTSKAGGVRSRWVARDFKKKGEKDREDLFASMPPLEAKKAVFRMAATKMKKPAVRGRGRMKLLFIDVRKAHLNGVCDKEVYVELPEEAGAPEGKCGKLKRWLYGMRPAAQAWEKDYSDRLQEVGLARGLYSPVVFFDKTKELRLVVHGDDFTFLGYEKDLDDIEEKMGSWYDIKVRGRLGDGPEDVKKIDILNRSIIWTGEELVYRADEKHAEILLKELGLEDGSRGLTSPTEKEVEEAGDELTLSPVEATRYRALTARANYLAQDRADIQFAVKELCRRMSSPTVGSWKSLKRLCRYLLVVRNIDIVFPSTDFAPILDVYTDSDWAGDKNTRKSTSGGFICLGGGL
jgi:hypothetical protein